MIAKISATENLGGALGYNFKKVEKGDAEVILSKGLYQSTEGEFEAIARHFKGIQGCGHFVCR